MGQDTHSTGRRNVLKLVAGTAGLFGFSGMAAASDAYVETARVDDITDTSASMWGRNAVANDSEIALIAIEYGLDKSVPNRVEATPSTYGWFFIEADGLSPNTTYYYRAYVETVEGHTATGDLAEFTTLDGPAEPALSVTVGSATDRTDSSATLNGTLEDMGGADSVDVSFELDSISDDLRLQTTPQTLSALGDFSASVDGLEPDTSYEYEAIAEASDGDFATSYRISFSTDSSSSDSAPTVEQFDVQQRNQGAWTRATVDWTAADADDNLDQVTTALTDGTSVLDSATTQVTGGSASGTHEVRTKAGATEVRLTIKDSTGREVTDSASL